MTKKDDFEESEKAVRDRIRSMEKSAIDLRSKEREFHGLNREFLYHQAQMLSDFDKSKDIKHPRDLGAAREQILRKFLTTSGYLPKRFGVSERSVRVASTSGHLSKEIDIAFFEPSDSITLMNREDVYEVHPVESVYGVIQVKSLLTKAELKKGLENLQSFKKLNRHPDRKGWKIRSGNVETRGFGILFAYDSAMAWTDIVDGVKAFAKSNPKSEWANAVVVLGRGFILHGGDGFTAFSNNKIDTITDPTMYGFPDRSGDCLFNLQSMLLTLLRETEAYPADIDRYFKLPLVSEEQSYSFTWGVFGELGRCPDHGDFTRKISKENLEKIVSFCRGSTPINWVKSTHIAYGLPEDQAAYDRQPGDVYIYNPDNLPLPDILTRSIPNDALGGRAVAYDGITTGGMNIQIPFYYTAKEGLISDCPGCFPPPKATRRRNAADS